MELKNKNELIQELKNLNATFTNVLCLFEELEIQNNIDINNYIVENYPFHISYNDLCCDVGYWVETVINNLNK